MTPRLLSLCGWPDLPLSGPLTVIGRTRGCEARIESSRVSRRHCCIALLADLAVVRDLGSTNGTAINGIPVEQLGVMRHGDELGIAHLRYRLEWPPAPAADPDAEGEGPPDADTSQHLTLEPPHGGDGA